MADNVLDVVFTRADEVLPAEFHGDAMHLLCKGGCDMAQHTVHACPKCSLLLYKRKEVPSYALANGMWIGDIPDELRDLWLVEKIMIIGYRHNVCIVTVATGAHKMHANAVIFSQPVPKFYRSCCLL